MGAMGAVGRKMAARGGPGSRMTVLGDRAAAERDAADSEKAMAAFEAGQLVRDAAKLERWNAFLAWRADRAAIVA